MMRLVLYILFVSSFWSFSQEFQEEGIISYHSDIVVQKDCDVLVKETIRVYAKGVNIRRGIFRELPLSYAYYGGNVHVGFDLISVLKDGEPEPHHTQWMSNGIRIYAGDEDTFLPEGEYTYTFTYRVENVLGIFKDRDEIYWNVNGNGWSFEITEISARITFPKGADLKAMTAYTGYFGEDGKDFTAVVDGNVVAFKGTRPYRPTENMTIAVGWDKGHLNYPGFIERTWYLIKSYILWFIGITGILVGLFFNLRSWWKYGRDPKPGTIIPLFYPPADFSAAECAYLMNNGRQTKSTFGSALMGIAVKGHVKIDVQKTTGWGKDYVYTITEDESRPRKELNDIETKFVSDLLGGKGLIIIREGKYNARLKIAFDNLIAGLEKKQKDRYFVRNAHLKLKQFIFPMVTALLGAIAYWNLGGSVPVLIVLIALHVVMNGIFARLYEQPTKEGRKRMDELAGFKMYMKYADKERIRLNNPPSMDFHHFEENLPYAIALGVAEEWAGQFNPTEIEEFKSGHMPYYHGLVIASFADFSSNLSSTITSASVPPGSSGSASGGGGFSGGGGGGGGGGGW